MLEKKSILIIEDNLINLKLFIEIFQHFKFHTEYTLEINKIIDFIKSNTINLVLMDIQLGEFCGLDLIKMIREINNTIPVIAITAFSNEEKRDEIINYGFNDLIFKPTSINILKKVIDNHMLIQYNA